MALEIYHWFQPLGRLGEELLDMRQCRRYVVFGPNLLTEPDVHYLVYYQWTSGDHGDRWVEYREDTDYDPELGVLVSTPTWREVHPIVVVHHIIYYRTYNYNLPKELEAYRSYGDHRVYTAWLKEERGLLGGESRLRPRWDGRCLMLGQRLCKEFKRTATEQFKLISAFNENKWQNRVRNPFGSDEQLKNTVRAMNGWENSPIRFGQNGKYAFWLIKPDDRNSPNSL